MTAKVSDLFHHRIVQVVLSSTMISQVGVWVRNFSIFLFIVDKTHANPVAISLISVAEYAPIFVFSFIGGTFADRWRPKHTLVLCNFLSALSIFIVLLTVIFATWKAIFFATLVAATISQFSQPAGTKLFKISFSNEQIKIWLPFYQTIFAVFMIFGPVLGSFVYQNLGINVAIEISGIIFLLSTVLLLFLPADHPFESDKVKTASFPKLGQEMLGGIRYVFSKKALTIMSTCLIGMGLGSGLVYPLGIFIITERLGLSKDFFQWFLMAYGIGMMVGGILSMVFFKRLSPQKVLSSCFLVSVIGLAIQSWSPSLWIVLFTQVFLGISMPFYLTSIQTIVIQNTVGEFIGRVSGFTTPMYNGTFIIALTLAGVLKQVFSLTFIYIIASLINFITFLLFLPIYRLPKENEKEIAQSTEFGERAVDS